MNETNIVIVGNVLTAPEWRRTTNSQQLVANFRVASTVRRYDRDAARWVDGNTMRLRVTAWRKLAEGVASSVHVGDPVIVYGRIFTRDWVDEEKKNRVSYEMEAFAVGHDLSRGRGKFYRNKPAASLAMVEDSEADAQVLGEHSVTLDGSEAPVTYGEGIPDEVPPGFLEVVAGLAEPEDDETGDTPEMPPIPADEPRRGRRGAKREPVAA
ncbi:single-stranded DNA-binding protein [Actinoplanes sp. CA-015351]|uniref:single-stranded DNA-binding protein n=1 Tax=Actinoplanes sp. CA-015351 TaxID=3239897 RepID=UPI003D97710B